MNLFFSRLSYLPFASFSTLSSTSQSNPPNVVPPPVWFVFQNPSTKVSIQLSESARKKLSEYSNSTLQHSVRLKLDPGGCKGLSYTFETTEDVPINPHDICFQNNNDQILIDKEALSYIDGIKIDFVSNLIRTGFDVVFNPQEDSSCSCGASFSAKQATF